MMTDPCGPKAITEFWCGLYQQHIGAKYPFNGGKDGKTIQWLRSMYSDDELRTFMASFFEIDDEFIQNSGYGLGVFRGCLPKVIQFATKGQKKKVPANLTGIHEWMLKRTADN